MAVSRSGLGVVFAVGYDLLRREIFALDLQLGVTGGIYRDAFMGHAGLSVAASWY